MRTALALALLPLLLARSPSAGESDLVVHVVDKQGVAVEGIQVGLCPVWAGHASTSGIGVTDAQGVARIVGGIDIVRRNAERSYFVRLGAPFDPDVRCDVDREHLDDFHPTLTVPDHGGVILKLPEAVDDQCRALLRVLPQGTDPKAIIRSGSSLPQLRCKGHQASYGFVGLGLELECEVLGGELPAPLLRSFRGPIRAGETVTITLAGFESSPKLVARLVDEDSNPLVRRRVHWDLGTQSRSANSGSWSGQGGYARTDESGRIVIPLTEEQAGWPNRRLTLKDITDAPADESTPCPVAFLGIPEDARGTEIDFGELMLASFGSPKPFASLDDKALEKRYLEMTDGGMSAGVGDGDRHVELLCEMVRRGGAELQRFVTELADAVSRDEVRRFTARPNELLLRTALARMRHEPDPLALVVDADSDLDVVFPVAPKVRCMIVNRDSQGRSYELECINTPASRIDAVDSTGHRLGQRVGGARQGWGSGRNLESGQCQSLRVDLGSVEFPGTGEYRVQISYSPDEDLDSVPSMRGRIVFSTREFKVNIRSCTIDLTQARLSEMRAAVRALDLEKSVPLVGEHWSESAKYQGPANEPEEILFRAGREALPALLDALEDPKLEPARRAWVFGMLWNIAGTYDPAELRWRGVLNEAHRIWKWPSVEDSLDWSLSQPPYGFPSADKQAELTTLWLAMKASYELKIVP